MTAGQGFNKWFLKKSIPSRVNKCISSGSGKSCQGSRERKNAKKKCSVEDGDTGRVEFGELGRSRTSAL